jgi:hypothetical protein
MSVLPNPDDHRPVSAFTEDDVGQTAHVQNALDITDYTPCARWPGLNAGASVGRPLRRDYPCNVLVAGAEGFREAGWCTSGWPGRTVALGVGCGDGSPVLPVIHGVGWATGSLGSQQAGRRGRAGDSRQSVTHQNRESRSHPVPVRPNRKPSPHRYPRPTPSHPSVPHRGDEQRKRVCARTRLSSTGRPCQRASEGVDRVYGNTGRPRPNRQRRFVLPGGDPRLEYRAPTRSTPRQGCGPVGLPQQSMIGCGGRDRFTWRPCARLVTRSQVLGGRPAAHAGRHPIPLLSKTSSDVPGPVRDGGCVAGGLAGMSAPGVIRGHDVALPAGGRSARHSWPRRWAGPSTGWPRWPSSKPLGDIGVRLDHTRTRAWRCCPPPSATPQRHAPHHRRHQLRAVSRAERGHRPRAAPDRRRQHFEPQSRPRGAVVRSWSALRRRWELGPAQGARTPRRDHGFQLGCCRPWEPPANVHRLARTHARDPSPRDRHRRG